MSKPMSTSLKKVNRISTKEYGNFLYHTLRLIASPAWQVQSIHCRRLIEFLEIEHLKHAGTENNNLKAPYNQLEVYGIGRQYINITIQEAEELGLLIANRGMRKSITDSYPNTFRLTYLPYVQFEKRENIPKPINNFYEPTNDWQSLKEPEAQAIRERYIKLRQKINKKK